MKKRNSKYQLQCNEEGLYLLKYDGNGEEIWADKASMILHGEWPNKISTKCNNFTKPKKKRRK